jgi:hypothetical protein
MLVNSRTGLVLDRVRVSIKATAIFSSQEERIVAYDYIYSVVSKWILPKLVIMMRIELNQSGCKF